MFVCVFSLGERRFASLRRRHTQVLTTLDSSMHTYMRSLLRTREEKHNEDSLLVMAHVQTHTGGDASQYMPAPLSVHSGGGDIYEGAGRVTDRVSHMPSLSASSLSSSLSSSPVVRPANAARKVEAGTLVKEGGRTGRCRASITHNHAFTPTSPSSTQRLGDPHTRAHIATSTGALAAEASAGRLLGCVQSCVCCR